MTIQIVEAKPQKLDRNETWTTLPPLPCHLWQSTWKTNFVLEGGCCLYHLTEFRLSFSTRGHFGSSVNSLDPSVTLGRATATHSWPRPDSPRVRRVAVGGQGIHHLR